MRKGTALKCSDKATLLDNIQDFRGGEVVQGCSRVFGKTDGIVFAIGFNDDALQRAPRAAIDGDDRAADGSRKDAAVVIFVLAQWRASLDSVAHGDAEFIFYAVKIDWFEGNAFRCGNCPQFKRRGASQAYVVPA